MLSIRCKMCNTELTSTSKIQCCGCPNMMKIIDDTISALDLDQVVLINSENKIKEQGHLRSDDLQFQENRRKRKVRKLNFEIR
jgi:competence protein ComGC